LALNYHFDDFDGPIGKVFINIAIWNNPTADFRFFQRFFTKKQQSRVF